MPLRDIRWAFTGREVYLYRNARWAFTGALKNKDFSERCAITGRKVCFYGSIEKYGLSASMSFSHTKGGAL